MADVKWDELKNSINELQQRIDKMDRQIQEDIKKEIKDRSENYAREMKDELVRQFIDSNEFKEAVSKVFAWGIREQMEKSMGNVPYNVVENYKKNISDQLNQLKKQVDNKQQEINKALEQKS